jgi:hypothetical protein
MKVAFFSGHQITSESQSKPKQQQQTFFRRRTIFGLGLLLVLDGATEASSSNLHVNELIQGRKTTKQNKRNKRN